MIQSQHNKNRQDTISFHPKEEMAEVVADLYRRINGFYNSEIDHNTESNFSIDNALDTIDRFRSPLAEKRLEGEQFSEIEITYLEILDSLTDKLLSLQAQMPEESVEVRLALEHAKRVVRNK